MAQVILKPPIGPSVRVPEADSLRDIVLEATVEYWSQGGGGASLMWIDGERQSSMLLLWHVDYGFYLQYEEGQDLWLSLGNRSLLHQVVECADEWYASVGLFITKEEAWLAVKEFCQSGRPTSRIDWISPDDVPEDGNW